MQLFAEVVECRVCVRVASAESGSQPRRPGGGSGLFYSFLNGSGKAVAIKSDAFIFGCAFGAKNAGDCVSFSFAIVKLAPVMNEQ